MQIEVTREKLLEVASKAINLEMLQQNVYSVVDTIMKKNAEYGDAWQKFAIFIPLIRIREKIVRLEHLIDRRTVLVYDKDVDEELSDIIAYALLAKLWMSENFELEMEEIVKKLKEEYDAVVDVSAYQHFDFTVEGMSDEHAEDLMDNILSECSPYVFGGGVHPMTDDDIPDDEVGDD